MRKNSHVALRQQKFLLGIMLAVLAWGSWLAIGALRAFHPRGDWRQGAIIYACTLGFLVFWLALLWWYPRRQAGDVDHQSSESQGWSRASIGSALLATLAMIPFVLACQAAAARQFDNVLPQLGATICLLGAALVMTLVGLSHPARHKGKFLNWIPLLMIIGMITVWFSVIA